MNKKIFFLVLQCIRHFQEAEKLPTGSFAAAHSQYTHVHEIVCKGRAV